MPHPAMQIFIWMTLSIAAQLLPAQGLFMMTLAMFLIAAKLNPRQLFGLLRRTRWILLTLLLIYAYSTPGVALIGKLGQYSPSLEGLQDGLLQLGRLLSVLSGLAILLASLSESRLIEGIHALAFPLNWLGGSRERLAVRLALTLRYAESTMRDTAADWKQAINRALQPASGDQLHVVLEKQALKVVDMICLVLCAALLYVVWI